MKSIIQKRIIPARTQFQDEKFSNWSTMGSMKVRSGHSISRFVVCAAFSLSFQAVVLLVKLQNESLPKDIGQELLIVNNSV